MTRRRNRPVHWQTAEPLVSGFILPYLIKSLCSIHVCDHHSCKTTQLHITIFSVYLTLLRRAFLWKSGCFLYKWGSFIWNGIHLLVFLGISASWTCLQSHGYYLTLKKLHKEIMWMIIFTHELDTNPRNSLQPMVIKKEYNPSHI